MVATRRTPAKKKASSSRSPSPSPPPRKRTPAKRRSTVKKESSGPGKELVGQRVEILWEAEKTWYGGTITTHNVRAGTHTIDYDDGETYIHDLSLTKYRVAKAGDEGGSTSGPTDTATATDAELVAALLPQEGDCVSIKWAGAPACICILRKDKSGDLIPVKPSEVDEQVDEEEEETESVPTTDDGLNSPMHSLGTSVKLVLCAVAVGVACFLVDPEESEKLLKFVQNYTSE